jgi:NADH:ubiquinone oxidoreductase subunit 5 (subunit L)/multisubunit Na+/H+ antiporter MnhA subunit
MPELLAALIPGLPFLAAAILGSGIVAGRLPGEPQEKTTGRIALGTAAVSFLLALVLLYLRCTGQAPEQLELGTWLRSGDYRIAVNFRADTPGLALVLIATYFSLLVARFAIDYLHREPGYHRFFAVLSLFGGALNLLALGGNAALTFLGWEIAGVCSYLLIAYAYDRDTASRNATRAFLTNRAGDAGFVLGIGLAFLWLGSVDWPDILQGGARLNPIQVSILAACFLTVAAAKSAQGPFAPWIARALEGPTPSSAFAYGAVMVHAGVFLLLRLEPLFEQSPPVMTGLLVLGGCTALYGWLCGLVQTDVKSALMFATVAQVGLMFAACGLGWWQLATWHLAAHAILRGYQFLSAPSLMHQTLGRPTRPVAPVLARQRTLYAAAVQRWWLEPLTDWLLVRPVQNLARDLEAFDERAVNRLVGLPSPAVKALSSLAQWEERRLGALQRAENVGSAPGLFGRLTQAVAHGLHAFEERWILHGVSHGWLRPGRRLGHWLNRLDRRLAQPRYAFTLVVVVLLASA